MERKSFRTIASDLAAAFRLPTRPLVVYGSSSRPQPLPSLAGINRCLAVALYRMAAGTDLSGLYVSADTQEGCCPGGLYHMGFIPRPEEIRYFISTGRKDVRGGAAEYLISGPELVDQIGRATGRITPPGEYLVVQSADTLPDPEPAVRSFCFFGNAEQIRNMAALVHFGRGDPFSPVIVPFGSACSTYITYPAGMAEHAPLRTAFMGPQDPTQNHSLPADTMALGVPADMAVQMAADLGKSFVVKRPQVAFPRHRS